MFSLQQKVQENESHLVQGEGVNRNKDEAVVLVTCSGKPKVADSSPAVSYVQRWTLCSNRLANVKGSVKRVQVVERN